MCTALKTILLIWLTLVLSWNPATDTHRVYVGRYKMDIDIPDRILEKLQTRGATSVLELVEWLNCSETEIHLGLAALRKQNLVKLREDGRWIMIVPR